MMLYSAGSGSVASGAVSPQASWRPYKDIFNSVIREAGCTLMQPRDDMCDAQISIYDTLYVFPLWANHTLKRRQKF